MRDKDIKNAFAGIGPTEKQREKIFKQVKSVIVPICKISELIKCVVIGLVLMVFILLVGAGISLADGNSVKEYIQDFFEFREAEAVCYAEEMDR